MLYATARTRRRLFRAGDDVHPSRAKGRLVPEREQIPGRYRHLLDWYASGAQRQQPVADPLLALRGTGRELWRDEPADEYVLRLREGW
jgi:hypothetical protein